MKPSTQTESSEPTSSSAKVKTTTRCRLCRETIVLESSFRAATVHCPSCGLQFTFDPEKEPLPVRGMRLQYSAVTEAQRRGSTRYTAHPAHVQTPTFVPPPQASRNYLAWGVRMILVMAAGAVLFGGIAQRLLHR